MAPATKISLDNAKKDKLFYFVANAVVYRESDGRCLILKRDPREKVHPGKYGVIGGKLEWKDIAIGTETRINGGDVYDFENAAEKLLLREAKEEAGIVIDTELKYINTVAFIRPDETPVVLVKFAVKYLSGDVVPEVGGFTDFAWVNAEEAANYDLLGGVLEEIQKTIKLFKK
jgi:8-oxo-dGTP pyrophosphatase MutT (NUDIX family)